jgi:CRISPR-associated protein Csd2
MTVTTDAPSLAQPHVDPHRRHDAVLLFDVTNGNPNGDPDAGNQPRVNPLDMRGLVTDVAIKRKIRNYIAAARPTDSSSDDLGVDNARYKVYVEEGVAINSRHRRAYTARGLTAKKKVGHEELAAARAWMCENFFDIRLFGAVMSTEVNCGKVKGPVQVGFASSVDPIFPIEQSITRMAVTKEDELTKLLEADAGGKDREMGRKTIVPYGLYRANMYYSPHYGVRTGVTSDDLALLWKAAVMMWDLDRSAARADLACRGLYVFTHADPLGDAPSYRLTESIVVTKKPGVDSPSSFAGYEMTTPSDASLPAGIEFSGNLA